MSYTMHSPSQGYTNASADVYASRAYGSHLMAQNYTAYLNRDDPYSSSPAGHYPNGPGLHSAHYGASGASMPQQTYPTLPPISHFPHQQDVYSSCVTPSPRNHSYPSTAVPVSSSLANSLPRHALSSKTYWESLQQQAQQNCYPASNALINPALKTPPQTWSHSPNVLSSPSSTPSPISCPSTPHHFTASSPHHSQSHADGHKAYNGIISNTSLPNSNNGNTGANLNCNNNNPLQSLQKMVQIESENNDIRVQYETSSSVAIGNVGQHPGGQSNSQVVPLESDPNYPTYYNLDQNRMCATPQSGYSNIPAQTITSTSFSPTMKNQIQPEIRPQSHQSNCSKQENGSENGDLISVGGRTSSVRYPGKLSKENGFLNNRSCSTDTVCSNGSPSAQSAGKTSSIAEPVIQAEQTHDSVNSFRGSETANSRDSVKSTDSDAMSSYAASQCPTPNNNSNWKLNTAATQASDFRPANFSTNVQSKSWWPESAISPSASRSFTPHLPDCSAQYGSPTVSYPSPQMVHGSLPQANGIPSGQPWSQQPTTPPSVSTTPQLLPGAAFSADGVVMKKKRGRPFGSKNRRNLENPQNAEASKRKRKSVLVDIGVNTTLTFDVQTSLNLDDSLAFAESSVKHALPLAMKRKKFVGPVVRIDKSNTNGFGLGAQAKYSVVNKPDTASKLAEEEEAKQKVSSKAKLDLLCPSRKNGLSKKCSNLLSNNANSCLHDKNWNCVLCHKGPHYKGLGDLYGPYTILLDKGKLPCPLPDVDSGEHDIANDEVELSTELGHSTERRSLRRRGDSTNTEEAKKQSNASTVSANNEDSGVKESSQVSLEVWIHEDCIVWSNNVYLDGTTIRNLEPAIVESFSNICTKCKLPGATLGCIYKNCTVSPLHYLCAKDKDCDLDEEKFILSCSKHKKRRIAPKEQEVVEVSEATTTATIET